MAHLTVGELRRILSDQSLPDDMPVVSWDSDLTGRVAHVLSVGVIKEERRYAGGFFIGETHATCGSDAVTFIRRLFIGGDD